MHKKQQCFDTEWQYGVDFLPRSLVALAAITGARWMAVHTEANDRPAMIGRLRRRVRRDMPGDVTEPAIPDGRRVYAIGDVHGRMDLFAALVAAIEDDDRARGAAETTFVLLGDLVDRGPASADVVASAMAWGARRDVRLIAANHEEMFLAALDDVEAFRHFLRVGGRETIHSYGIDAATFDAASYREAQALARAAVPERHRAFLAAATNVMQIGDYVFAHAGIRPGLAVHEQSEDDLRWIREPFLTSDADHGVVVVHGHTITDEPVLRHNRIGIDTGAYRSGRLTALGLEGTRRWLVEARAGARAGAGIEIAQRPA